MRPGVEVEREPWQRVLLALVAQVFKVLGMALLIGIVVVMIGVALRQL